jgi:signal peptidase I
MSEKNHNLSKSLYFPNLSFLAIIQVFLSVLIIVLILKSCVVEFYRVESGSMEPELYKGDIVVVSRIAYFFGLPTRFPLLGLNLSSGARLYYRNPRLGEVVVIDAIESPNINDNKFIIKRITGLPGDTVSAEETPLGIRFHLSKSSVNNNFPTFVIPKKDDFIKINSYNFRMYQNLLVNESNDFEAIKSKISNNPDFNFKLKVKNNFFFVQGDNSMVSYDSRSFGIIPQKSIIGKGLIMFLSGNKNGKKGFLRLI